MEDFRYPLVSELLFRAQNNDVTALPFTPIGQLWHIDSVNTGDVLLQLEAILCSRELSTADRLKLGFLIAYSWPLHCHPKTHDLLLIAQGYINRHDVQESLLFWSVLAGYYLRRNQVMRAISNLAVGFDWASKYGSIEDTLPLLNWSIVCFSRLNRQQEALSYSCNALRLAQQLDNPRRVQAFGYARAHTLMRMGNYSDCIDCYEILLKEVTAGTAQFEPTNHIGVINGLAKIAIDARQLKRAENLLHFSAELSAHSSENLLLTRGLILQCELELAKNNNRGAHSCCEALSHHRSTTAFELDIPVEQRAQQLQLHFKIAVVQPKEENTQTAPLELELAIHQLHKSSRRCQQILACSNNAPAPALLH